MRRKSIVVFVGLAALIAVPAPGEPAGDWTELIPGEVRRFSPGASASIRLAIELEGDARRFFLGVRTRADRARFLLDDSPVSHTTTYDYSDFAGYEVAIPAGRPTELRVELTSRTSLELFALFSRTDAGDEASTLPAGFPGPYVILSLSEAAPSGFAAWFDRGRLGTALVPRGIPGRAGNACGEPGYVEELRSCAHSIVAGIDRCLAKHGAAMTSRRDALALYLDDLRIEEAVSELVVPDCRRVAALNPTPAARERAEEVLAAAFARFETESPGIEAASAVPGAEGPSDSTIDTALGTIPVIEGLEASCAGEALLTVLRAKGGPGEIIGLSLLVEELGEEVRGRTGRAVGPNDPELLRAVDALRELPGPRSCDSTVAVMAILDEWKALASGSYPQYVDDGRRFVQRLSGRKIPRGKKLDKWLAREFPILHREASEVLDYVL